MSNNKVAGMVFVKVNGQQLQVKGNVKYCLGTAKREDVVGHDGVHGYSEKPQAPYIECEITDKKDFDVKKFFKLDGVTVTVQLANGKTLVGREMWYSGDATGESEDGKLVAKFSSKFEIEEVK